jgi:hypothetical protein
MTEEEIQRKFDELIARVRDASDADVLFYSGGVYPPGDNRVIEEIQLRKERKNLLWYVTTTGGLADCAYRMTRFAQTNYEKITVLIPSYCKSAGTLMALGAHEIGIRSDAELGPLDVQISKRDEIFERSSGLTHTEAFLQLGDEAFSLFERQFLRLRKKSGFQLTSKTCAEIASKLTIGLLGPIYAQIDPLQLGETQRAMKIAVHYGARLGKGNWDNETLLKLVANYPSHEFVIDAREAEELFNSVRALTPDEEHLALFLAAIHKQRPNSSEPSVWFAGTKEEDNADEGNTGGGDVQTIQRADGRVPRAGNGVNRKADGSGAKESAESADRDPIVLPAKGSKVPAKAAGENGDAKA